MTEPTKLSTYTLLKKLINNLEIGAEISRFKMQSAFRKEFKQTINVLAIDSYKSYFLKLGFLEPTITKGFYTVAKHIPEEMSATDMRALYNEATGYAEKQTAKFKEVVSNAEYLEIKYKPVEFAVLSGLSYIQGAILKHIVDHVASNDKLHLESIVHYATIADFLNHKHKAINSGSSNVDRFCEINGFNEKHALLFRKTLLCNWDLVLKESKSILEKV